MLHNKRISEAASLKYAIKKRLVAVVWVNKNH